MFVFTWVPFVLLRALRNASASVAQTIPFLLPFYSHPQPFQIILKSCLEASLLFRIAIHKQPVDETGQTGIIELIDEHDQQLTKVDSDVIMAGSFHKRETEDFPTTVLHIK